MLTPFFNIKNHHQTPISYLLCNLLSDIDPVIWNRLAKTSRYNNYSQSFNIIQCNESDNIESRIDVSRIQSKAEEVKKEKRLFPTEDDRFRPLGFNIKYRAGERVQELKIVGHLWDRQL